MKEIKLIKSGEKIIGAMRVSDDTHKKLDVLAKKHKVSVQTIVKLIVDNFIDEVNIT